MPNMLRHIASRQLAVLHRYFSATGQEFNNPLGKILTIIIILYFDEDVVGRWD